MTVQDYSNKKKKSYWIDWITHCKTIIYSNTQKSQTFLVAFCILFAGCWVCFLFFCQHVCMCVCVCVAMFNFSIFNFIIIRKLKKKRVTSQKKKTNNSTYCQINFIDLENVLLLVSHNHSHPYFHMDIRILCIFNGKVSIFRVKTHILLWIFFSFFFFLPPVWYTEFNIIYLMFGRAKEEDDRWRMKRMFSVLGCLFDPFNNKLVWNEKKKESIHYGRLIKRHFFVLRTSIIEWGNKI
jgi:hypothetical protein